MSRCAICAFFRKQARRCNIAPASLRTAFSPTHPARVCGWLAQFTQDFANAENTNVSYWLTFASSSHMDHWFVQDFISALPTSSEGVVYAIDYQYSEHDSGVLATVGSTIRTNGRVKCQFIVCVVKLVVG